MPLSATRLILYVRDVPRLSAFYQAHFDLAVVEAIGDEWAVLQAGDFEIALHQVGRPYRQPAGEDGGAGANAGAGSNAKLVFTVPEELEALRERLVAAGVAMRPLKRFPGFAQLMCDGEDPEGNVFQLSQPDPA